MPSQAPTTSQTAAVTHYLDAQQVPYRLIEHPETFSATAEANAAHAEPAMAGKTLLLHDRGQYSLMLLPARHHADLPRLRYLLGGTRRLRLATEAEMARDFPDYEVGALPPLGPSVPPVAIVDVRLLDAEEVLFAAGDHRHSIVVPIKRLLAIVEPRLADVCEVRNHIEGW